MFLKAIGNYFRPALQANVRSSGKLILNRTAREAAENAQHLDSVIYGLQNLELVGRRGNIVLAKGPTTVNHKGASLSPTYFFREASDGYLDLLKTKTVSPATCYDFSPLGTAGQFYPKGLDGRDTVTRVCNTYPNGTFRSSAHFSSYKSGATKKIEIGGKNGMPEWSKEYINS